ncbi:ABC transporter permease [Paenibacillus andongensis]|uniref:ABC transporter permease n=1 Tax=Paenibacillus andongensis TaxID=2975482 RepID=UPI0021BBA877|nr:ABC-2 family transporter protein [Paenibacillus andongensis]
MQYVSLYFEFIKIQLLGILQYKKAFTLGLMAQLASYGAEFFLLWIIINKFNEINGWGSYEVLLLYAFNLCSYALASFFLASPSSRLSMMIKDGTFDEVLTKPLNNFLYLVCREFNSGYISHLLLSIVAMVIALSNLNISMSLIHILFFIIVILSGALIQGAALLLTAIPSFWVVENSSLKDVLFFQMKNFIRYPISIYPTFIQILLTFVLPYAFINFYPAQFFLNKNDFLLFHPLFQFMAPVVGIVLSVIAYALWLVGINNYKSTGS